MMDTSSPTSWRWLAVCIFVLASLLNYLDRSLLSVLAPLILKEFNLNQLSFGYVISIFSVTYAVASLFAGMLLDRLGLNKVISGAIAWWSTAGILTALTQGFNGLLILRGALGVGESAGIPAFGKLNGLYLKPSERALGAAVNQIGLSLGPTLAALALPWAIVSGWRLPFVVCGALGFVWIPVWLFTNRKIPPQYANFEIASSSRSAHAFLSLWSSRDLWILVCANFLWMGGYSLWSNWITLYLVHVQHVPIRDAARYVWIPPAISTLGGFFGGWLSLRWINQGFDPVLARQRTVWISAIAGLLTLALPLAHSPSQATALISVSFFFLLAGSVNIYSLPIDIFGTQYAGSAIASLVLSYGLLQTVISPIIGWLADHHLYSQVVWLVTAPLLLSALTLLGCSERRESYESVFASSES